MRVPEVCLVLEGGACTIRAVLDYVTNSPPVPVVVCDGSGRAADLIAFTHKYVDDNGQLPELLTNQLLLTIQSCFGYSRDMAENVYSDLLLCVRKKNLITVFRLGEDSEQEIDHAILTGLLKGHEFSATEQLSLALTWNRPDIARAAIFTHGQDWPAGALDAVMMDALIYNRSDFVKLLLQNGVSMDKFLTIHRLEELYNTDKGPTQGMDGLRLILSDVLKHQVRQLGKISLYKIGLVMQKLIGMGYRAHYCRKEFRQRLERAEQLQKQRSETPNGSYVNHAADLVGIDNICKTFNNDDKNTSSTDDADMYFKYPFSELLVWAVLLRRQKMALCMWQHGEEALAKALIATRLYKSMAKEAAKDYLEVEICEKLDKYSDEFRLIAIGFLEHCYETDDDQTFQLLTYELSNWGNQTCLSLAYIATHMDFLAHPGCQILLTDLWHGGIRIRRNSNLKVLMGLLCPLTILTLEFKTKEELLLQPQTKEEYIEVTKETEHDSPSSCTSSDTDSGHNTDVESGGTGHKSRQNSMENRKRSRHLSVRALVKRKNADSADAELSIPAGGLRQRRISVQMSKNLSRDCIQMNGINNSNAPPWRQVAWKSSGSLAKLAPDRLSKINAKQKACDAAPSLFTEGNFNAKSKIIPSPPSSQKRGDPAKRINSVDKKSSRKSNRPLDIGRKLYEFYAAPITTFWAFTMSYFIFLISFTYVVLIRTTTIVSWVELWVIAYVIAFGFELVRKLCMQEPHTFMEKAWVFLAQRLNFPSTVAVLMFILALFLRLHSDLLVYGRVLYCCNIVYWIIYTLEIVSVHKYLGPYITMMGKMVIQLMYFTTIISIVLMSFGVVRQSLTFPNENFNWALVRNIFYKPYFMIYGEVYAAEIDQCVCSHSVYNSSSYMFPECSAEAAADRDNYCSPGAWLTPVFMAVFLLICDILLINVLIAAFNNTFTSVNAIAQQVWKYHSYYVVMEYEQKPWLPPPFIVISHLVLLWKYCSRRFCGHKKWSSDHGLKLFLNHEQVEKLHDFEEQCMDALQRQKELTKFHSNEDRVRRTAERADYVALKMEDLALRLEEKKFSKQSSDSRLQRLEDSQEKIMKLLERVIHECSTSNQRFLQKNEVGFISQALETETEEVFSAPNAPASDHVIDADGNNFHSRNPVSISMDTCPLSKSFSGNHVSMVPEIVVEKVEVPSFRLLPTTARLRNTLSESNVNTRKLSIRRTLSNQDVKRNEIPSVATTSDHKQIYFSPTYNENILMSRHSDYSTITDDIDTSCVDSQRLTNVDLRSHSMLPAFPVQYQDGIINSVFTDCESDSSRLSGPVGLAKDTSNISSEYSRYSPYSESELPVAAQLTAVANTLRSIVTSIESEQDEQALARQHEEYAGALTTGMLTGNQNNKKPNVVLTNLEELQNMGLDITELDDYRECLAQDCNNFGLSPHSLSDTDKEVKSGLIHDSSHLDTEVSLHTQESRAFKLPLPTSLAEKAPTQLIDSALVNSSSVPSRSASLPNMQIPV